MEWRHEVGLRKAFLGPLLLISHVVAMLLFHLKVGLGAFWRPGFQGIILPHGFLHRLENLLVDR